LPRRDDMAHHFICIDEYGKGTEDLHASALCCAALELFDQVLLDNANGRLTDYKSYRLVGLICPDNMLLHYS
jgi:hypothetical protein